MARDPFFTVVIPIFNRADRLEVALKSVLAQGDQDFDVAVVDDGSTDNPRAVVESFNDERFSFIRQENRGGGAARNAGIDAARGRFIAFLDSDDAFLPHHLAAMRELVSRGPDVVGYSQVVADRGTKRSILKPPRAIAPGEHMSVYLLAERGFVPTSTIVVSREWAVRIRFPEELRAAEDTDFAIRLYLAGCTFAMAEKPGTLWQDRQAKDRTSGDRGSDQLARWLESMRGRIPERAYYGCLGWSAAKQIAARDRFRALRDYFTALLHGAYRPSLAPIVFLQVALSDRQYRVVADKAISWFRAGRSVRSSVQAKA